MTPLVFNFDNGKRQVAKFTPWPLYPPGNYVGTHRAVGSVKSRGELDILQKEQFLPLLVIDPGSRGLPACNIVP